MSSGHIRSDVGVTDRDVVRSEPMADTPSPPRAAPVAATGSGSRLAWLGVLRGIAALAVVFAVALAMVHLGGLRGEDADPETSVLSQLLMMSNVLGGENLPNVVWSLSYEMVFYLLITALFIARVHKRSSWYALAFAAAAVAIGGLLPQAYFIHNVATPRLIALVADMAVLAGLALAVVLRGMSRLLGAAIAAVVAVALLAFNGGWIWPWEE